MFVVVVTAVAVKETVDVDVVIVVVVVLVVVGCQRLAYDPSYNDFTYARLGNS